MNLNQLLKIKISKKDEEIMNEAIVGLNGVFKSEMNKTAFIRMCINGYMDHVKKIKDWDNFVQEKDICNNKLIEHIEDLRQQFDIRKISSSRKESYKDKHKGNKKTSSLDKIDIAISVRVSEKQRDFIEEQIEDVKKKYGLIISIGDFIRFCIRSEVKVLKDMSFLK